MKINPIVFLFITLSISQFACGQEKLVPMKPQGDPELIVKSKEMLESEFGQDSRVSIRSVEPFDAPALKSIFHESSPTIVKAIISHPDSGHATIISFIVSSSGQKYVIDHRSMEPSSFLKALKSHKKRVESTQDAEIISRAFAELCGMTLSDKIETKKNDKGYTVSLPYQSGKGDAVKPMLIDLELLVERDSGLVSAAKANSRVPADSEKNR